MTKFHDVYTFIPCSTPPDGNKTEIVERYKKVCEYLASMSAPEITTLYSNLKPYIEKEDKKMKSSVEDAAEATERAPLSDVIRPICGNYR